MQHCTNELLCLLFLGRRSVDCIQYLNSGSPINLRASNIHSVIHLTLKGFTLSLTIHKVPRGGVVLEGALTLQ